MAAGARESFLIAGRSFEGLLKSKFKDAAYRRKVQRNLLTLLVQNERVIATVPRCKDLSRVADRMIDLAKADNEPIVYSWLLKKELVPKVFNVFVPRFSSMSEGYTIVYRLPPKQGDRTPMGIVEFIGNTLKPLQVEKDVLIKKQEELLANEKLKEIPKRGTLV